MILLTGLQRRMFLINWLTGVDFIGRWHVMWASLKLRIDVSKTQLGNILLETLYEKSFGKTIRQLFRTTNQKQCNDTFLKVFPHQSMSMCLVLSWNMGFWAIWSAYLLSQNRGTGLECEWCISHNKYSSHCISQQVVAKALLLTFWWWSCYCILLFGLP